MKHQTLNCHKSKMGLLLLTIIGAMCSLLILLEVTSVWGQEGPSQVSSSQISLIVQNPSFGWRQSNESGFGDAANTSIGALGIFDDRMYAGTWNENGAQVWRTSDGHEWEDFTPTWPITDIGVFFAKPFGSHLYLGVGNESGGEIWRTDGTEWEQVASGGLGNPDNYCFFAATVFQDEFFTASGNVPPPFGSGNGVEIWKSASGEDDSWQQVNSDGFGRGATFPDVTMEVYQDRLYVGLSRPDTGNAAHAELWRSYDGMTWTAVFTDGLGVADNTHLSSMAVFRGKFYIAFRNTKSGGQLWRSENGTDWEMVFDDGLGNPKNSRPYGLLPYGDQLILVFSNHETGVEVWQSADGLIWFPINQPGWGDETAKFADYFDNGAVVFKDSLYIGTIEDPEGGRIWQRLHLLYLPTTLRNP
ncbi:MAG: hypothetical protein N3D16_02585 [Anaerolineales bacterium]|nr:hypothetical protein [Anaerolineales bacterium]